MTNRTLIFDIPDNLPDRSQVIEVLNTLQLIFLEFNSWAEDYKNNGGKMNVTLSNNLINLLQNLPLLDNLLLIGYSHGIEFQQVIKALEELLSMLLPLSTNFKNENNNLVLPLLDVAIKRLNACLADPRIQRKYSRLKKKLENSSN